MSIFRFFVEETLSMKVDPSDYVDDLLDHSYAMKIGYLGNVAETKQTFVAQDDFRLRTLIPDVTPVSVNL